MINGVSAASESSARIRSPMEFPWLLYWISFKFVTLSGAMLIAARYESSRLRGVHLSFRGEESLSRARGSGLELHTVLCIRNDSYVRKALSLPAYPVTLPIVVSEMNLLPRSSASIKQGECAPTKTRQWSLSYFLRENLGTGSSEHRFFSRYVLDFARRDT